MTRWLRRAHAAAAQSRLSQRPGDHERRVSARRGSPGRSAGSDWSESADDTSRLVDITANIEDPSDRSLRPGSFAEITVPVASASEAPVIPVAAVRPSARGFLAYVVEGDRAVERILTLGMSSADGRVEVLSGLKGGESLVIRGSEALSNGVSVRIGSPAAAPAAPEKK